VSGSLTGLSCTLADGSSGTISASADSSGVVTLHCNGVPVCTHSTGINGVTYQDCTAPLGIPGEPSTYSQDMADRAAAAISQAGTITANVCTGSAGGAVVILAVVGTPPILWAFSGAAAGHVNANGSCPTALDPTWN